jgi:hypothetical protein
MELLATLNLSAINSFFSTFFALPQKYWRGFLASTLSAGELIGFAGVTFVYAAFDIKYKLMAHLFQGESCLSRAVMAPPATISFTGRNGASCYSIFSVECLGPN